ncbi:hypothetical protein Tco_0621097 [Tanacetum coccineum]
MAPKKTTTPINDAQLKTLIAQGVANALAKTEANRSRNGDDSHDSRTGIRRQMHVAREYTYSDFLKCQPLNFKGIEGVVGLTQWIKKMESVFHINNYTVTCQVKFTTCTLLVDALTWSREQHCELQTTLPGICTDVRKNVSRGVRSSREICWGTSRHDSGKCDGIQAKNNNHGNQAEGTEARGMVYALGGGETNQDLDDMEDDINS